MRNKSEISALLGLILLILWVPACSVIGIKSCGSGVKSLMLKRMLNAGDNMAFDRALVDHGALTGDELPCVLDAIESWSPTRRKNGAKSLSLVGGDREVLLAAQKKVILETSDLFVWAKVFDSLVRFRANPDSAELAAGRHDMIAKALSDKDGFIQSVGLKAGVLGKFPGIETELGKRLDSMDSKILSITLDALPPEMARRELARLLSMLEEYETGTRYLDYTFKLDVFTPLVNALIRTEDPKAYRAVRSALEKGYKNAHLVRGTREEFSDFRNTAAVLKVDPSVNKFLFYLIDEESIMRPAVIDILTTQIEVGKRQPDPEIVKICVATIEAGNLDNTDWRKHTKDRREQLECEMFFKFLESGVNTNVGEGKRRLGADAVKFGRKWLEIHK